MEADGDEEEDIRHELERARARIEVLPLTFNRPAELMLNPNRPAELMLSARHARRRCTCSSILTTSQMTH